MRSSPVLGTRGGSVPVPGSHARPDPPPPAPASLSWTALTCALADGIVSLVARAGQFAVKILFPELGEPDVSAVVLQGARHEVLVKP